MNERLLFKKGKIIFTNEKKFFCCPYHLMGKTFATMKKLHYLLVPLAVALTDIAAAHGAGTDPEGYSIDMTTGSFTAGSGSFRSKWESTSADPHLTFACGPNNMNSSDDIHINIFSGTALSSDYTLSCSEGYLIDRVELTVTATSGGISIVDESGTTDLTQGTQTHFTWTDVFADMLSFTLKGPNKQVTVNELRAFLILDDGTPHASFLTTEVNGDAFADSTEWYFLCLAAPRFLLHDNAGSDHIALEKAYNIYTRPTDALEWCFSGNNNDGYLLYNRQAGTHKVLAAPTDISASDDGTCHPVLVDADHIPEGYTALWQFDKTTVLGTGRAAYFMFEKDHPSNKVNLRNGKLAFWISGADKGSAVSALRVAKHPFVESEPFEELFPTYSLPYYRIPAICCTRKGSLIAVGDYRYGGKDIGYGSVELRRRISHDNGATWGDIDEFTHGNKDMTTKPNFEAAFGDPCIVADRTSDLILLMSCSGNIGYPLGTRESHQGIMRFYSTDEGETWSEPVNLESMFYALFDNCSRGPIRSMFIASGKIHQSRYVKVGKFYRLYCASLTKDANGTECNYVFYSDDFGETWHVLGSPDTPAVPSGANEPKVEELPDGSIVCSSRMNGGRFFNIFSFTDTERAEGSWGTVATSASSNKGVIANNNSCNGEILILPAIRKVDGEQLYIALQSVPIGPGRANVGIYWKELSEKTDMDSPANFAKNWNGVHQSTTQSSAYSTMCLQANGQIAFFYEEDLYGAEYSLLFKSYTLEAITDSLYSLDSQPSRFRFLCRTIDDVVGKYYTGGKSIVGAPDPAYKEEVDAAVAAYKEKPDEGTYNHVFETLKAHTVTLEPNDKWYALRNSKYATYYMKNQTNKLTAGSSLVASSATQHFRFLPADDTLTAYYIQSAQGMKFVGPASKQGTQLQMADSIEAAGIYTLDSDIFGRTLLSCTNGGGSSLSLVLNSLYRVTGSEASEAGKWYIEQTDYVPVSVENITEGTPATDYIFDLQGRRVASPQRGLYIRDGRKILVR